MPWRATVSLAPFFLPDLTKPSSNFTWKPTTPATARATWPAPTDTSGTQGANALYQVDNTTYAGDQPIYKLIIPQAEWAAWTNLMDSVPSGHFSDAAMNATLIAIDGTGTEVRYGVNVRNRGAGTTVANPHNFHLSISQRPLARRQNAVEFQHPHPAMHKWRAMPFLRLPDCRVITEYPCKSASMEQSGKPVASFWLRR